ncbi:hypothetical protein [Vibrio cholerae]|uniref:hypothetical protein n=1 Tax=Vibrio cholerae TaxID=666 RepID=UPI000E0AC5D3|nr:hypothetical protein [Vibrio cholerae]
MPRLKRIVYLSIVFTSFIIQRFFFYVIGFLFSFKKRKKILIYSDSRGHEVTKPWNKHNPFSSYVSHFFFYYDVDYYLCPEFSTTFIDFLYQYKRAKEKGVKYDFVISHIGLVDFSPRPVSMLKDMLNIKRHKIEYLGLDINEFISQINHDSGYRYYGERTNNFYTKEYFCKKIIPMLKEIENIIFIGCNRVLLDWDGNYWRKRPENINEILMYNDILLKEFPDSVVDISHWCDNEIREFTVDNIHLNKHGYTIIKDKLNEIISCKE